MLEAVAREVQGAPLERAKLLWHSDKQHRALAELQGAVKRWVQGEVALRACVTT